MNVNILKAQLKRECWEHKTGFIYAPLIISVLIVVLVLGLACYSTALGSSAFQMHGSIDVGDGKSFDLTKVNFASITQEHPGFFGFATGMAVMINTVLISLVSLVVYSIYGHSTLFDDRKNRDILFWRSMPVSESTNVLVKLAVILALAPLTLMVLNLCLGLIVFVISFVYFMAQGVPMSTFFTSVIESNIIFLVPKIYAVNQLLLLLLAPVLSFFLFCSALSKKSPVFISAMIPIAFMVLDKSLRFFLNVNIHFIDLLNTYWGVVHQLIGQAQTDRFFVTVFQLTGTYLIAWLVTAGFIALAIWLRNHRYEI